MSSTLKFDYYYGIEAEQFSFYRVPRLLIKDERFKGLSSDAKLLYGLMLDRMALSIKNGWIDDENRAYVIYTIDNIREDLGCSKEKAVKILAELDSNKGIGLVEKIRRGLGKPDIIYVKNFAMSDPENAAENIENEACNADVSTEVGKADFKKSEKPTSRGRENRPTEVGKSDPNYNNKNYTDLNYINPINQSMPKAEPRSPDQDGMDVMDDSNACVEVIRENIAYARQMRALDWPDRERYRELYELICETVCVRQESVKINGADYPYELVRSRFLKLNSSHLEYVMDSLKNTTTKITNIRAYLLTALFNAPSTMNHSIRQEVQHDMFGGGWEEKGIV